MTEEEKKLSQKIIRMFHWFNFSRTYLAYFSGFFICGFMYALFLRLSILMLLVCIMLPFVPACVITYFVLKPRLKACYNSVQNNAAIKSSVGDYLIKKVSKHRYGRYKYFYIESLKEIEDGRYVDGLIMMLNSKDYYKKIYAVKALRYTRDERVLKPLEEKFNDKSEHVRSEAILAYDAVKREVEFKAEAPVYRDTELTSVAVPSAGGSYSIKDIQIPDYDCVECPVCKAVQRNNRTRCYNCGARFE